MSRRAVEKSSFRAARSEKMVSFVEPRFRILTKNHLYETTVVILIYSGVAACGGAGERVVIEGEPYE